MSKRFFPQQHGDRKRTKLDISISDHNFPLSQNKESDQADTWGDDNDDEILLLASQACEEAYNANDISLLPNYSICMQPGSTSTQMHSTPGPSSSKTDFTFKKPSSNPPSAVSTNLREKYNRISSPLPGLTANVMLQANGPGNISDDLIFNDKVCKGQDSDYIYRQLLQMQEENAKLKSENGKLLEKCVTKEGEASILRTQLKTCQVSVDNARLEKIKAQERVQMEWTEKLATANNQMHDLKTQLDFKNLEIISIKEKCKKLESTKVRLTQVTVGNNDISSSYRPNSSLVQNESFMQKKVKIASNAVQTEDKAHFMPLNKTITTAASPISSVLPLLLGPTSTPLSLLDYNEKLTHTDMKSHSHKCRYTFHRTPSLPVKKEGKVQLSSVYEDIVKIAAGNAEREIYFNVFNTTTTILTDVANRLETISQRMTTAFHREMDEKYMESTSMFIDVCREDLLKGGALYKEEQEILARRMTAILSYVIQTPSGKDLFNCYEQTAGNERHLTDCIYRICCLLETTSTATVHSGLLLSVTHTLESLAGAPKCVDMVRSVISARAAPPVSCRALALVRSSGDFNKFCPGSSAGNLKMDYDQGVLLYKKDNCHLQILLKQVEVSLKCMENQQLADRAADTARDLIGLYSNITSGNASLVPDKSKCDCQLVLMQVIVYALRICAVILQNNQIKSNCSNRLLGVCTCGLRVVSQWSARDADYGARLAHSEGHLAHYLEIMALWLHDEIYVNMITELAGTLQSSPEDTPPSFHRQPWLKSFDSFSVED